MYLFSGVSDSSLSSLFCGFLDFLETLVTLSAILLTIKSPVASAVFWIALSEAVFIVSVVDFFALSHIYCLNFYPGFLQKTKIHILLHLFYP